MVVDTITASNYLLLTGGTLSGAFGFTTATGTSVTSTNAFFSNFVVRNVELAEIFNDVALKFVPVAEVNVRLNRRYWCYHN